MDLDDVWVYLGDFGRYQIVAFLLITLIGTWFPAWQIFGIIFTTDSPPFHCRATPGFSLNDSIPPWSPGDNTSCFMYSVVKDGNETSINETSSESCANGYEYEPLYGESTIVNELDLVCERDFLPSTAQSIYFTGVLVGAFVFGQLSDLFGRKTSLLLAVFLQAFAGTAIYFVYDYTLFCVVFFFIGMCEQGMNLIQFVLIMEMFSPKKRAIAGCINNLLWGVGVTLLTPIAYFIRDWRIMQLAISLPCLIAIPLWFVLYESVRWLLSKGRNKQSFQILNKIARVNKISPPADGFVLTLDDKTIRESAFGNVISSPGSSGNHDDTASTPISDEKVKTYTLIDLFRSKIMVKNLIIMCYSWFVNSMVYYGVSLYSSNLAGDKYLNYFLISIVEIPAYIITAFTILWWGRRPSLALFHFLAGIFCVLTACLPRDTDATEFSIETTVAAMLGKFSITASFGVAFLYGTEIFPTPVRNIGYGIASICGRVGSILAPFIVYLDTVSTYVPLNIFGGLSLIAGILVLLLPETRNKPLPETMEDAEMLGQTLPIKKRRSFSNGGVAEDIKSTNGIVNVALEDMDDRL